MMMKKIALLTKRRNGFSLTQIFSMEGENIQSLMVYKELLKRGIKKNADGSVKINIELRQFFENCSELLNLMFIIIKNQADLKLTKVIEKISPNLKDALALLYDCKGSKNGLNLMEYCLKHNKNFYQELNEFAERLKAKSKTTQHIHRA